MTDLETRCLDRFPEWLKSLPDDARELSAVVEDGAQPDRVRRAAASALNYLFKSLDLIPDGIEDLGFLDDAFVFRVACALGAGSEPAADVAARLARDAALLQEFLSEDYPRLEKFVTALGSGAVRGRSVDDIVTDPSARSALVSEVKGWAGSFVVPSFNRDTKNLVKLRSFLKAKLPA